MKKPTPTTMPDKRPKTLLETLTGEFSLPVWGMLCLFVFVAFAFRAFTLFQVEQGTEMDPAWAYGVVSLFFLALIPAVGLAKRIRERVAS